MSTCDEQREREREREREKEGERENDKERERERERDEEYEEDAEIYTWYIMVHRVGFRVVGAGFNYLILLIIPQLY